MSPIYISIFLISLLAACSSDTVSSNTGESADEDSADVQKLSTADSLRLEIPRLDSRSIFVAHYTDCDNIHVMNYAVEWNPGLRHANWVAFRWDAYTAQKNDYSRSENWGWDPLIPSSQGAVTNADHKRDGYDKGHLVASNDRRYCEEAEEQTYYYSNISPQMSSFNQGIWQSLEDKIQKLGRSILDGAYDTVYVVKGGSVNDLLQDFTGELAASDSLVPQTDSMGKTGKGLIVPANYFMAVLTNRGGDYSAVGFYVPHREVPTSNDLSTYALSIDELESLTGIDFFHNLPDSIEQKVESIVKFP